MLFKVGLSSRTSLILLLMIIFPVLGTSITTNESQNLIKKENETVNENSKEYSGIKNTIVNNKNDIVDKNDNLGIEDAFQNQSRQEDITFEDVLNMDLNRENYGKENIFQLKNQITSSLEGASNVSININGNNNFSLQATTNNWPGNGTLNFPYIIENNYLSISSSNTNAISIQNTDVYFIIKNNTLESSGYSGSGIYLYNVTNSLISNNTIISSYNGIYLDHAYDNSIINNTITNTTRYGIYLYISKNDTLKYNTNINSRYYIYGSDKSNITNNKLLNSIIQMDYPKNNCLINNTFINGGLSFQGSSMTDFLQLNVENNSVNDKPLKFLKSVSNQTITGDFGQLILINATDSIVKLNTLSLTSNAIQLYYCMNSIVENNTLVNNLYAGIYLYYSLNITVRNNILQNNSYGLNSFYITNCSIYSNNASGNQ